MSTARRVEWIDASKGIGIFLVIIGHTMIDSGLRGEIYAFHMPLFFLISGFLFSIKKYSKFQEFLAAKAKSLLIPYLSFAFISLLLLRILLHQSIDFGHFFKELVLSRRNSIYFDDPLWFLTSLFTMEIIFYFLVKFIKNHFAIMIIVIGTSFIAVSRLDALPGGNILPWSFDQTLYFIFYFGIGYVIKQSGLLKNNLKTSSPLIIGSIIYLILLIFPGIYTNAVEFLNNKMFFPSSLTNYLITVLWAVFAISFVTYLSQYLSVSRLITFIGRNSLILLALHISLGFNLFNLVAVGHLHLKIANPNLLGLAFTLGTIAMLIPVSMVINKYFPFILGKNLLIISKEKKK
jgi:acyltransferase